MNNLNYLQNYDKMLIEICTQCNKKIATNGKLCNFCIEENNIEFEKCKSNPYYFFTKYCTINGRKATTHFSEKDFNEIVKQIKQLKKL